MKIERIGYCWWLLAMGAVLALAIWLCADRPDEDCGATFCCREHAAEVFQ